MTDSPKIVEPSRVRAISFLIIPTFQFYDILKVPAQFRGFQTLLKLLRLDVFQCQFFSSVRSAVCCSICDWPHAVSAINGKIQDRRFDKIKISVGMGQKVYIRQNGSYDLCTECSLFNIDIEFYV